MRSARTGTSGAYLRADFTALGAGRVDQADAVIGEIGHLEHSRPRVGFETGFDVGAVLAGLVGVGEVDGVGHRGHQVGDPPSEGCRQ